jgi:hypothetical protein
MLIRSRFAIAAALILGAVSAAQASNENADRELGSACGPLHQRMGGRAVNPVYNRSICYGRGIYAYARSRRMHRRWWFY